MFEHITTERPRRRWARVAVAGSVAGHIGVVAALAIAAFWQVDKLEPDGSQAIQLGSGPPSLTQGGAPPPLPPKNAVKRKSPKTKIKVKALRQPTDEVDVQDDVIVADADPNVPGHENGVAGSRGNNPNTRRIGGIGGGGFKGGTFDDSNTRVVIEKEEEVVDKVVPAHLIRGKRTAGTAKIQPPKTAALKIKRSGKTTVMAMVKMCLSASGTVRSLRVLKSSDFPAYDAELKRKMRQWRYRPYTANGRAIGVCTVITFVYRPQ